MKARAVEDGVELAFDGVEREFLVMALLEAQDDYAVSYEHLPKPMQRFWAGRLSDDPELAEAADDLREARLAWRSERARVLDRWLAPGGLLVGPDETIALDVEEAELFLAILNDRRLALAVQHGFDKTVLEDDPDALPSQEAQRAAWKIHYLAEVMEICLAALRGEEESSEG